MRCKYNKAGNPIYLHSAKQCELCFELTLMPCVTVDVSAGLYLLLPYNQTDNASM